MIKLLPHQQEALKRTAGLRRVAYYHDMGLGKTYVGSEKMMSFNNLINLVVCQKSKVEDWVGHFKDNYDIDVYDLTSKDGIELFTASTNRRVGIINYDIVYRRPELFKLAGISLVLDESSMIQNDKAKRTKAVLKLHYNSVVLLSGTPVGGRYENLYTQLVLLGCKMTKRQYWYEYIDWKEVSFGGGFPVKLVTGYRNVKELKNLLGILGADFLKTTDVLELPEQRKIVVKCKTPKLYNTLLKDGIITVDDKELIADTPLKSLLYSRVVCGAYCTDKLNKFKDLIDSTESRIVVFYNFQSELNALVKAIGKDRPISIINGSTKDLDAYNKCDNSITLVQYQAGAMGLNLQQSNVIVYFSLPLSSELYEQSKKRIHRIGQKNTCLYYILQCLDSVEEDIEKTLDKRKDYTDKLFVKNVGYRTF